MTIGINAIKTSIIDPIDAKLLLGIIATRNLDQILETSTVGTTYSENPLGLTKIKIVIVKIGPTEAKPTKPNELSRLFLPPLVEATPAPNANMKGTVALPVVTPPASKMNGKNF